MSTFNFPSGWWWYDEGIMLGGGRVKLFGTHGYRVIWKDLENWGKRQIKIERSLGRHAFRFNHGEASGA